MKKSRFVFLPIFLAFVAALMWELRQGVLWLEEVHKNHKEVLQVQRQKSQEFLSTNTQPKPENSEALKPENSEPSKSDTDSSTSPVSEDSAIQQLFAWVDSQPLMPVCAALNSFSTPKIAERLRVEAQDGDSKIKETFSNFIRLRARSTAMDLILHLPENRKLVLLADEDESVFYKTHEAQQMLKAGQELDANLMLARDLENKAYRAFFIGRILLSHPDLMGDPVFQEACQQLESHEGSLSIEEMNQLILGLLKRSQLNPDDVGFDPTWTSNVQVKWERYGAIYRGGLEEKLK